MRKNTRIPGRSTSGKRLGGWAADRLFTWLISVLLLFLLAFFLRQYFEKSMNPNRRTEQETQELMNESEQTESGEELRTDTETKQRTGSRGRILLDPGHGGEDPGMVGGSGISEKILNLVFAQKLKPLLEQEGYEVLLTREDENGLCDPGSTNQKARDMQLRVEMIRELAPDITVSIHQNSYPDPSVRGPQIFYFEHSAEGEKLASSIQEAMNQELEISRPRVPKGNTSYYILKRSESVTVIVECGFLSCPQEEELLQQEDYQNRAAAAVAHGILQYLESKPDGT